MLVIIVKIARIGGEMPRTDGRENRAGDDKKNLSSVINMIENASCVFHLLFTVALKYILTSFPLYTQGD